MKIKIWRKDPRAKLPQKSTSGSIGYDIFALEETQISPKEFKLVRTGLVIKGEPPYGVFLFPRSSLFKKKQLIMPNSIGVIDFDYCGKDDEIKIPLLNLGSQVATISAGEKIAQLIFIKVAEPILEEVDTPPQDVSRGGFGSTGIK